jgi:hypothetical protein
MHSANKDFIFVSPAYRIGKWDANIGG